MKHSQILNQRVFNLSDGDRYIIAMMGEGDHWFVLTRIFEGKPITSSEFTDAKTYKNRNTAEKVAVELVKNSQDILGDITMKIFQVKALLEPRYFVQLKAQLTLILDKYMRAPELLCYPDWFTIGENNPDTFLNYNDALDALETCKKNLVEFYYNQIMLTRNYQLKKI